MIKYFVIAADGQKYGPADVPTLNTWIAEGRLQPTTMLQEANSSVQVEAHGVPALKFTARPANAPPPSAPAIPPASSPAVPNLGNPYDTPTPPSLTQPQTFSSNYPRGPAPQPNRSAHTGAILMGWASTDRGAGRHLLHFVGAIADLLGLSGGRLSVSAGAHHSGRRHDWPQRPMGDFLAAREGPVREPLHRRRLPLGNSPSPDVLWRRLHLDPELFRRLLRPVRISQIRTREQHDIRLAARHDLFRLARLGDEADGSGCDADLRANGRRERNLVVWPGRDSCALHVPTR